MAGNRFFENVLSEKTNNRTNEVPANSKTLFGKAANSAIAKGSFDKNDPLFFYIIEEDEEIKALERQRVELAACSADFSEKFSVNNASPVFHAKSFKRN